jgi:hypothetical protein
MDETGSVVPLRPQVVAQENDGGDGDYVDDRPTLARKSIETA